MARFKLQKSEDAAELLIYDAIGGGFFGGVSAQDVVRELRALGKSIPLTVRINSPGGSVFDGFAIYNALKRHEAEVVVEIDGLAASAASVIAMAGSVIRIASNASIMIHEASTFAEGGSEDLRKTADLLDKIREDILDVYEQRTGQDRQRLADMVAAETWLSAAEALELGFADEISGEQKAAASADFSRLLAHYNRVPETIAARFAAQTSAPEGAPKETHAPMPDFSPNLASTLGLPSNASEADLVVNTKNRLAAFAMVLSALAVATADEAVGAVEGLKLKAKQADEFKAENDKIRAEQDKSERETLIKDAKAAGKLTPALERDFIPTLSTEALRAFVKAAPKVAGASEVKEVEASGADGPTFEGKNWSQLTSGQKANLYQSDRRLYDALKAANK